MIFGVLRRIADHRINEMDDFFILKENVMRFKVIAAMCSTLFLAAIACMGGGAAAQTIPEGITYSVDLRPLPADGEIDTLMPLTVGSFTRTTVEGVPTGGTEAYGTYESPMGEAFLTVSISDTPGDAAIGIDVAKGEVVGNDMGEGILVSLDGDPAYFYVNREDVVFFAWTHGVYMFSVDPYNNPAVMDAFIATYPY
jgi:hypothetical protein